MADGEWSKNVGTYDNVDCRQESLAWIAPEQGLRESRYSFRRWVPINAAGSRFREYRLLREEPGTVPKASKRNSIGENTQKLSQGQKVLKMESKVSGGDGQSRG
jgi:hypothetical protein